MARMTDEVPVSNRQLLQLATVATEVSRADNVPLADAFRWLARQFDDGQWPGRLFSVPRSPNEPAAQWSRGREASQWKLIRERAEAQRVDANKMPSLAHSRYLHVDDIATLAASPDTSESAREDLTQLLAERAPKLRAWQLLTNAASVTGSASSNELGARAHEKPHAVNPVPACARIHRVGRDLIAPMIERVRASVVDGTDTAQVFAELERLARQPDSSRPAPLAGVTSGGVQWHDGGKVKVLTRKILGQRLLRLNKDR